PHAVERARQRVGADAGVRASWERAAAAGCDDRRARQAHEGHRARTTRRARADAHRLNRQGRRRRPPVSNADPRFVVIGAGMAGILSAIKLGEAGYTDVTIYEKADRLGGTWRENTYPGIACDVPSHLYSYSFAPNPDWSHVFSPGPEICAYFEDVA